MNNFISEVTNEDCMEGMARYPDKYFDLAIVDPPYGIGVTKNKRLNNNSNNDWDNEIPSKEYFNELFRVSQNQIIWGGNYFIEHLKNTRCYINWDKLNHSDTYADCEMAWTSFNENAKIFKYMWDGNRYGFPNAIQGVGKKSIRTHPTQKPVALYKWLLHNYAKQGDKILDTHLGSGSSRIAAYEMGFDFTGFELDKEYFDAQEKRYKNHIAQLKLELT
jgi:site-specific DNA-methyltransferase (adenine-specific)